LSLIIGRQKTARLSRFPFWHSANDSGAAWHGRLLVLNAMHEWRNMRKALMNPVIK
jgi:hypothetical protein